MSSPDLILASQSTARADLMSTAGYRFLVVPSGIPEPAWNQRISFRCHLVHLARDKAWSTACHNPRAFVIGADTALLADGRMLGKAATMAKATRMLRQLVGRKHTIITALCVVAPVKSGKHARHVELGTASATVCLRNWKKYQIEAYIRKTRPFYCAGAYAIQDGGASIVRSICGDIGTVIGMPLDLLARLLRRAGYDA